MPAKTASESSKGVKRPASEESSETEEPTSSKRPRRGIAHYESGAHSEKKAAARTAKPVKAPKEHKARPPSLNPLRKAAERVRPARQLFVYGNGDFGQLGLGPDETTELFKPKLHEWCAEAVAAGSFGEEGAGIEAVAAGGMHSLMVDEEGKVCFHIFFYLGMCVHDDIGLVVGRER